MSKPRPFLNTPYGAYFAREVPPPDDELVRVGPGTPCGEYLRRFWQPVAFARDLKDVPLRIRIMSEDLVIFRDKRGSVGLLQLNCAHRGTSLEYGLVSERGIRCCYHGWLYDVDGSILEMPGEPATSTLKDRLCQGAYPVHEYCGLIFAYMGPPEKKPAFPLYDTFDLPGLTLMPAGKFALPCNWLQIKDNSMDPVHTSFLHAISSGYQFTEAFGALAELDWEETPYGMTYIATRRVGDLVWVRVADFMAPNVHQFTREFEDATKEKPASRMTARTRSASGTRPTMTRSRGSARSPCTRSSIWPRPIAASPCCARSCATASAPSPPAVIRRSSSASRAGPLPPPVRTGCSACRRRTMPRPTSASSARRDAR